MAFHTKKQDLPKSSNSEEDAGKREQDLQQSFNDVLPKNPQPVDIDKKITDTFNSDIATDKIKRVFYEEIDRGKFAAKVKAIGIKERKVYVYDTVQSRMIKYGERLIILVAGMVFATYIWPFIKGLYQTITGYSGA